MCFRLYLVVWQIHYLPIYYYTEYLSRTFSKKKLWCRFSPTPRNKFVLSKKQFQYSIFSELYICNTPLFSSLDCYSGEETNYNNFDKRQPKS